MIELSEAGDKYKTTKAIILCGYDIPKGFEFDGMSAPWVFRSLVGGPYRPRCLKAVLLHDWLYHSKQCSRKLADRLFYRMLRDAKVKFGFVLYTAVRLFGWIHYR